MEWRYLLPGLLIPLGFAAAAVAFMLALRPPTRRSATLACLAVVLSGALAVLLAWGGAVGRSPLWVTVTVLCLCAAANLVAIVTLVIIAVTAPRQGSSAGNRRLAVVSPTMVLLSLAGLLLFAIWSSGD